MFNFNDALGVHEQSLYLRTMRSSLIANNIAHSDTPGFQARDINFESVLNAQTQHIQQSSGNFNLMSTDGQHLSMTNIDHNDSYVGYRIPHQASLDGNTVESHVENAEFGENLVRYQASLRFLSGKFATMKYAISGG
ncbi:MAG: flagellar basal body rod protein FlgB [Sinobacterium sp.]|nr:flagellar basal body rod protein FlgB [Sinobacterium sp.]